MTSALAQRIGAEVTARIQAEFTRDPSTRPHDEHLITELSNIALQLDSVASLLADAKSPLANRVENIAKQARKLLARVKGGTA
jgi:hypothetical protein